MDDTMSSENVHIILGRIQQNINTSSRLMGTENYTNAKICLRQCGVNLNRIRGAISDERYNIIINTITELSDICDQKIAVSGERREVAYEAERRRQGRGGPSVSISKDQLEYFLSEGYSAVKIARHLKCSTSLVYKKMYHEGLKFRQKYTVITDDALFENILDLHNNFPNSGCEMMCAYLRTKGVYVQRARVRTLLAMVDPVGTAVRWSYAVQRKVYSVPTPNALWHMDAHLKLVRWGFVTHGCIDGFSRLIIYAKCTTSITANTVIKIFVPGVIQYGVPSRVRSDHGYENFFVAVMMNMLRGTQRGSHITGKSTHNQRIERLWRDIFQQVIDKFYREFYLLETEHKLDPQNPIHRFVLQFVYLKEINKALDLFVDAWNKHKVRTENQKTPRQLWLDGMLNNINSDSTSVQEVFTEQPDISTRVRTALAELNVDLNDNVVEVLEDNSLLTATLELSNEEKNLFENIIDSFLVARDKYIAGVHFLCEVTHNVG